MKKITYKDFTVYTNEDKTVFIHLKIDCDSFYDDFIKFFFSEERLLGYINNKTSMSFNATVEEYVDLYKALVKFIDSENLTINIEDFKKELSKYIDWENYSSGELLELRRDKIGKVGEYILHNILFDYFKFTCVLPKLNLITNRNMSVFGIDVVFWNNDEKMLLFGESKVSKSLENGIDLINRSLSTYENQICNEFLTTLSSKKNIELPDNIKEYIGKAISFKKFIELSDTKIIGIPIFIMSGEDVDVNSIMKKMDKINKIEILNLDIKYYIINIPILDKNIFQSKIINFLRDRCDYYESKCQ